ncbi:hypothetical protein MSG37_06960 [Shewanella sp. 1CM18E]|uniref:hypothetical protein n=1 Tax=Shewanella sp. 1CM18E TaxID=2929169 RepID=UPI0020C0939C|nr:hypothetical protein [Shewanella sp. 1CM18E]MCK8044619.1 hypothetical protein [Shewanella sp. 1CM18E]
MMKKFILFLLIAPFAANAAAPYGLEWGKEFSQYGEIVQKGIYTEVKATELPKDDLSAEYYLLVGKPEEGLIKISMRTFDYSLFGAQLDSDYAELENTLQKTGYQAKKFTPRNTSSYQCIFQGNCIGRKLELEHVSGASAVLEVKIKDRNTAYINVEYFSEDFNAESDPMLVSGI